MCPSRNASIIKQAVIELLIVPILMISIIVLIIFGLDYIFPATKVYTETTFCSSGLTFIRFNEDGQYWGTILLDSNGKPIICNKSEEQ
jgi:hypothetical protein